MAKTTPPDVSPDETLPPSGHGPQHHHRPTGLVARVSMNIVEASMRQPRRVLIAAGVLSLLFAALFVRIDIDTDPENMLASDAPVRVRNAEMRETFGTGDMIVVGLFADESLASPEPLAEAFALHDAITALDGVAEETMISVRTASSGAAPTSLDEATALADSIEQDPLLGGNVLSADRDALAFFVPLDAKSDARPVRDAVNALLDDSATLGSLERHVAGLPLAQEAFGAQMFVQMAVFAPLAGLAIFALMMLFFRRLVLVGPAMLMAMLAVVWAMGALIGSGNSLHIMSSMIPIFLMPIAILDAVHVISEFFDRYGRMRERESALRVVFHELAGPIAFTSVTTIVGFLALTLTPIPPVQVFGLFIAFGVFVAWLATMTLLPAVLMTVSEASIDRAVGDGAAGDGRFAAVVRRLPTGAMRRRLPVLAGVGVVALAAVPLITTIEVNDNPVNWFRSGHEVRVATERLNDELPGTFAANLLLEADDPALLTAPDTVAAVAALQERWGSDPIVGTSASYVDLLGGSTGADAEAQLDQIRSESALVGTLISPAGDQANVRLQLRNGDNQAMNSVLDLTDEQLAAVPLPAGVTAEWAGETYLNVVWQDEMVSGMLTGFVITLAIITVLLAVLFRSVVWAAIGIAPVLWTILVVYGVIGLIGKDFDMPIAVLSTLVLGIGVDFAIHFVERFRELRADLGSAGLAIEAFAEEPARALSRNAAVIAVGFLPLLLSSLTPYVIVGLFLASIIVLSWLATVVALPALLGAARERDAPRSVSSLYGRMIVPYTSDMTSVEATEFPTKELGDAGDVVALVNALPLRLPDSETAILNAVRIRTFRQSLLDRGAFSIDDLAAGRMTERGAARKWLERQVAAKRLFTVKVDGRVFVPASLLDTAMEPIDTWAPILAALLEAERSPWDVWAWIDGPVSLLSGEVPSDLIETDPDRVRRAVERRVAQLQS